MQRLTIGTEPLSDILETAVAVLRNGGLVVYPTETMYGIGCDAQNEAAVTKLLRFKERPAGKAISVLVSSKEEAAQIVAINPSAEQLFRTFLPGPVTVVCKDKGVVDPRLPSELGTLGVRISSYQVASALAAQYARPLTSTSANAAGGPRPYEVDELLNHLSPTQQQAIDLIIDDGLLPKREPSTVIDTTQEVQKIIRSGERVEDLVPPFVTRDEEATQTYAEKLMASLLHVLPEKAVIFALEGEMGMGKTQFAKGVARALGIDRTITSPTFTLIKEYPGEVQEKTIHFIHIDLWRLEKVDVDELGLDGYIHPKYVVVIEWSSSLVSYLKALGERAVVHRLLLEENERGRSIRMLPL